MLLYRKSVSTFPEAAPEWNSLRLGSGGLYSEFDHCSQSPNLQPTSSSTEVKTFLPSVMAPCDVTNFMFLNLRTLKNASSGFFSLQGHQPPASSFCKSRITEHMPFCGPFYTSRRERECVWCWRWDPCDSDLGTLPLPAFAVFAAVPVTAQVQ